MFLGFGDEHPRARPQPGDSPAGAKVAEAAAEVPVEDDADSEAAMLAFGAAMPN